MTRITEDAKMQENMFGKMIAILLIHRANYSVEFFARHVKIRVRQTHAWDEDKAKNMPVFTALREAGYKYTRFSVAQTSASPVAIAEYVIEERGNWWKTRR
jgi:hypothetical protein